MSEMLTLGGRSSLTDAWGRDTNDGYSAKAISEQLSIAGLDIAARYTRTLFEWCMRNYENK
jgi:hypothetical protein